MTITEFLLARIAEDESQASNVSVFIGPGPDWKPAYRGIRPRVLAECEAKRRIVDEHPAAKWDGPPCCETCSADTEYPGKWPCETLSALASVYADHPGFNPEWRV